MTAPRDCEKQGHPGTYDVPVEDGKGNVIYIHKRCTRCHMILSTEKA